MPRCWKLEEKENRKGWGGGGKREWEGDTMLVKSQKELTGIQRESSLSCKTELRCPGGSDLIEGGKTAPGEILLLTPSSFIKLQ